MFALSHFKSILCKFGTAFLLSTLVFALVTALGIVVGLNMPRNLVLAQQQPTEIDMPEDCDTDPLEFEFGEVEITNENTMITKTVEFAWVINGISFTDTVQVAPDDSVFVSTCAVLGAASDNIDRFEAMPVTDITYSFSRNDCMPTPCAVAPSSIAEPVCQRITGNLKPGFFPNTSGLAELARMRVYQLQLPNHSFPTTTITATWVVNLNPLGNPNFQEFQACNEDLSQCGDITFDSRFVNLADFVHPFGSGCGEVTDVVKLCIHDVSSSDEDGKVTNLKVRKNSKKEACQ